MDRIAFLASDPGSCPQEVLGGPLHVRFSVTPQLFDARAQEPAAEPPRLPWPRPTAGLPTPRRSLPAPPPPTATHPPVQRPAPSVGRGRLRHSLDSFVVGASNQLALQCRGMHVAQYPGSQYTPLFIHGCCGSGQDAPPAGNLPPIPGTAPNPPLGLHERAKNSPMNSCRPCAPNKLEAVPPANARARSDGDRRCAISLPASAPQWRNFSIHSTPLRPWANRW